jgi:hypothetical protein
MSRMEERLRALEMRLQELQRTSARPDARIGKHLQPKNGWWIAQLQETLSPLGTADAEIYAWDGDSFEQTGNIVNVRDWWGSDTVASGTKIEVAWHRNFWHWRKIGGGSAVGVPFVNDAHETIPPHGIMWARDKVLIDGSRYVLCDKPSATYFDRFWLINGATAVPYGEVSRGFWLMDRSDHGLVAVNISDVLPGPGESWGPKPGSWVAHYEYPGFTILDNEVQTVGGQAVTGAVQHQVNKLFGRLYTDMTAEFETAQFEILFKLNGAWAVSPWNPITVHKFYLLAGESREKGTKGEATWYSNIWVGAFACDKEEDDGVTPPESQNADAGAVDVAAFGPNDFDTLPEM